MDEYLGLWTREDLEDYYQGRPNQDLLIDRYLTNRFSGKHIEKIFDGFHKWSPKDEIKFLLIGESPPSSGGYVYIPSNSKFKNNQLSLSNWRKKGVLNLTDLICIGFLGEEKYKRNIIENSLEELRDKFKFCVIDLSLETPLNRFKDNYNYDRVKYLYDFPHIIDDFKDRIERLPTKIDNMDIRFGLPGRTFNLLNNKKKYPEFYEIWESLLKFLKIEDKFKYKNEYQWSFSEIDEKIKKFWKNK